MNLLRWLKAHGETLSHWATTFGFGAAAIASWLAFFQIRENNEQQRWQNYNEMNVRYAELYGALPKSILSGCMPRNFNNLRPETKRWVRQYFDLYSEEYWLYQQGLIPKEMWTKRISVGVRVNLSNYPALTKGFDFWSSTGAFTHPDDFIKEVKMAIAESSKPPYAISVNVPCPEPEPEFEPELPKPIKQVK